MRFKAGLCLTWTWPKRPAMEAVRIYHKVMHHSKFEMLLTHLCDINDPPLMIGQARGTKDGMLSGNRGRAEEPPSGCPGSHTSRSTEKQRHTSWLS